MKEITITNIIGAEKILIDNGIEKDEAETVLQAIGYALLDEELYPEKYTKIIRLYKITVGGITCITDTRTITPGQ